MSDPKPWYAGIDWASQTHYAALLDETGRPIAQKTFRHDGAGLAEMAVWLAAKTGAADNSLIQVAIEVPHGPVVEMLLERGFAVHAINPKLLERLRDRFSLAGAKDDSLDARVMATGLRTDPHCYRRLAIADPILVQLREASRVAEELGGERNRLTNRLREQVWRYFPALLDLNEDLHAEWLLELWQMAPTPDKAARLRLSTLAGLLKRHHIRRLDAEQLRATLHQPPLQVTSGAVQAACDHIALLVPRIRLLNRQIKKTHRRLGELTAQFDPNQETQPDQETQEAQPDQDARPGQTKQRDAEILASLPGLGKIVLATLLAEAFDPLQRRDYTALRCLSGVAPVTKSSGKTRFVVRRHACHPRLAVAVYHWARVAMQHDPTSAGKYRALRSKGHSHARALRGVADRLLNVACSMLKTRSLFDPNLPKNATC